MYVNLIWIWGHLEVYIPILPLFGVFSEVARPFSGKRLFGYGGVRHAGDHHLVYVVWLHHFFTMGSGRA
jgi:cytochrome o ubiquinol oxidase subunit 1